LALVNVELARRYSAVKKLQINLLLHVRNKSMYFALSNLNTRSYGKAVKLIKNSNLNNNIGNVGTLSTAGNF
jgi:hypothetical protein